MRHTSRDAVREGSSDAERVRRQHPADRPGANCLATNRARDPGEPPFQPNGSHEDRSCAPNQHIPNREKGVPAENPIKPGSPFGDGVVCKKCGEITLRGHWLSFGPDDGTWVCSIVNAYGERDDEGNALIAAISHWGSKYGRSQP